MTTLIRRYPVAAGFVTAITLATVVNSAMIYVITKRVAAQSAKVARVDAVRQATAAATHERCLASRPILLSFNTHLAGVNALAETLVENTLASRDSVPVGSSQWRTRNANLTRIKRAREMIGKLTGIPLTRCK